MSEEIKDLAIFMIQHWADIRRIQYEMYASDSEEVKKFARKMPTIQGSKVQRHLREIAKKNFDGEKCLRAIKQLVD